jgi:hypothetical protein
MTAIYTLNFYQNWVTQRGWCHQRLSSTIAIWTSQRAVLYMKSNNYCGKLRVLCAIVIPRVIWWWGWKITRPCAEATEVIPWTDYPALYLCVTPACPPHINICASIKVKVRQPNYMPWQAIRVPEVWGSQILIQLAHDGGNVVSPTHRPPLPPGNIPGAHFC